MPRVTIKDIAEKAGVSKAAVSFAFNNPEQLSAATLERILGVARELGYRPHPVASNLKTRRTGCIGLLVPQPLPEVARNPHLLALMEGIGTVCHQHGLSMMVVPPLKGNLHDAVARAAVDGFLTLGLEAFRDTMQVIQERDVPFVMIDSEPVEGIPCVNTDDESGAWLAMNEILQAGHRQIIILGITSDRGGDYAHYSGTLKRRTQGYLRALEAVGLTIDNEQVRLVECACSLEGGIGAFEQFWQMENRPTAVVVMADVIAVGVLQAAQAAGVQVPQELSLIGYDDIDAARLTCPPLTTIRQPIAEKGLTAIRLLVDLMANKLEAHQVTLPVELVVRKSIQKV